MKKSKQMARSAWRAWWQDWRSDVWCGQFKGNFKAINRWHRSAKP